MTAAHQISVGLGDRSYNVVIGEQLIAGASDYVRPVLNRSRLVIVTDENVAAVHLDPLSNSLGAAGIGIDKIVLPAGEQTKSFSQLENLCEKLLNLQIERSDTLLALGGGVIGDLTGFASAILRRGCQYIQVPTTLLAQVDSSVGGKTAINAKAGKNLIGAFHQPVLVLADVDLLETLPRRELLAGYAEIVKYGLLGDAAFFHWLEATGSDLIAGNTAHRIEAVRKSVAMKAQIVEQDERESGVRALLNLGHTFGHALEAQCGYSDQLLHGESISIGMVLAFAFSAEQGLCDSGSAERVKKHLSSVGLPVRIKDIEDFSGTTDELMTLIHQDKKVSDGKLSLILAKGIGETFVANDVSPALLHDFLHSNL